MVLSIFNHPLLFAAVAIAAIGVVVYELVSSHEENKRQHRSRRPKSPDDSRRQLPYDPRRPPPNDPGPKRSSNDFSKAPYSPPPDSHTSIEVSSSKDSENPADSTNSDNNLRRRQISLKEKATDLKSTIKSSPDDSEKDPALSSSGLIIPTKVSPSKSSENPTSSIIHTNNLRPYPDQTSHKESVSTDVKSSKTSDTAGSPKSSDKNFDENNYCKNVLDKLIHDVKNGKENPKSENMLGHNICEEESDSSESNLLSKDEEKLISKTLADKNETGFCANNIKRRKRKSKTTVSKLVKNANDNTINNCSNDFLKHQTDSSSDSHSDNSEVFCTVQDTKKYPVHQMHEAKNNTDKSSKTQFSDNLSFDEDNYKIKVHEALKNDVNENKEYNPDSSVIFPSETITEENSLESNICKGCEEKHINTRAFPCNHSYLCADCAVIIFKLHKKCSICKKPVVEFVPFAS